MANFPIFLSSLPLPQNTIAWCYFTYLLKRNLTISQSSTFQCQGDFLVNNSQCFVFSHRLNILVWAEVQNGWVVNCLKTFGLARLGLGQNNIPVTFINSIRTYYSVPKILETFHWVICTSLPGLAHF